MAQIGFRTSDELKAKVDELGKDFNSNSEFLEELVNAFEKKQADNSDVKIDMSKYINIEKATKKVIEDAFTYILNNVDTSVMNMKKQAQNLELEKTVLEEVKVNTLKELEEAKAVFNQEKIAILEEQKVVLDKLQAELKTKDASYLELETTFKKEIEEGKTLKAELDKNLTTVKQIQEVNADNTKLREQINYKNQEIEDIKTTQSKKLLDLKTKVKELELSIINKDKTSYKIEVELENTKKELEKVNAECKENTKVLAAAQKENIVLATKLEMLTPKEKEEKGKK